MAFLESFADLAFWSGLARALLWLSIGFGAWWIMFLAPLGRRVFRNRILIQAPAEKIWSAYLLEPSPEGGWARFVDIGRQGFVEGEPLRHEALVRAANSTGPYKIVISRVRRLEPHAFYESEMESIDGAPTMGANAVQAWARFTPQGGATLLEQEVNQCVRGLFGHFAIQRHYDRYCQHFQAHCEGTPTPPRTAILSRRAGALLAIAAIGASALLIGAFNPGLGWASLFAAILLELAILIHESGHWLAMRWYGHADASIVFVSFFGGATLGARPSGSRFEKAMIALMGPAFSALFILALTPALPWGQDFFDIEAEPGALKAAIGVAAVGLASVSIPLNLFNLAPLGMLDGARVVAALAEGRGARLAAIAAICAALAFAVAGWGGAGDFGGLLAFLGVVWLVGLFSPAPPQETLAPMSRRESATVLVALAATLAIYVVASRVYMPALVEALKSGVEMHTERQGAAVCPPARSTASYAAEP